MPFDSVRVYQRALLLFKTKYRDDRVIIEYLTEEFGKLKSVLRGANHPSGKHYFPADPGNFFDVSVRYQSDKEWSTAYATECRRHRVFFSTTLFAFEAYLLEIVRKYDFDAETGKALFSCLRRALEASPEDNQVAELFRIFTLWTDFANILGVRFHGISCVHCGLPSYKTEENGEFIFRKEAWRAVPEYNGIACERCSRSASSPDIPVPAWSLKLCCLSHQSWFEIASRANITAHHVAMTLRILTETFAAHVSFKMLSADFLRQELRRLAAVNEETLRE